MMPSSFKGHGEKQITHRPVPITQELAAALESARGDRPDDAPLLLKQDGTWWQEVYTSDHRTLFRRTIERAELDPNEVTSYALRHSSIVRCLLGHVPSMVTAMQHDTSVKELEKHYAAFITDHSDALSRRALLRPSAVDGKVVPLRPKA